MKHLYMFYQTLIAIAQTIFKFCANQSPSYLQGMAKSPCNKLLVAFFSNVAILLSWKTGYGFSSTSKGNRHLLFPIYPTSLCVAGRKVKNAWKGFSQVP